MSAVLWKHRISILIAFFLIGVFAVDALAQAQRPTRRGTKYKVRIDSAPQQAAIYLDGEQYGIVGYTPWEGSLQRGDWTVIIKKDGYETVTRNVKVERNRRVQETFIPLVKKDEPAKLDVRGDADRNAIGAQVWVDGQMEGQIPVIITAGEGRHLIEVKKEGFQTFTQWIAVKEGEKVTVNPVLKEIEKVKKGSILIEADVPGAEVYIDGNRHPDSTPTLINDVIAGPHVIEVRKEPAMPWKQTLNVVEGQTVKVSAELKATMAGPVGAIRVLSNAPKARVYLDGTDLGPAPLDIKDVKPGEHVIEVKAPGYLPREERITVSAGSASVLKLDLQPTAAEDSGKIKVVSPVPEAAVFIDGERLGNVPQEKEVPMGEHYVVVTKPGYKKFEEKISLKAGQTLTVTAELAAVGPLRVLSTPSGAEVEIDGVVVGKTPFNADDVEIGQHVVKLRLPQHYEYEEQVTIQSGPPTIVNHKLEAIDIGPTAEDLRREQRNLTSFGARTLPLGRSTIDVALGYPYFLEGQVTVGAGRLSGMGFDAGVFLRTFFSRTEIGLKARLNLAEQNPFSFALFTMIGGGTNLFDNSGRNNFLWNIGAVGSLTAFELLTVSGRAYLDIWTDRYCPPEMSAGEISVCTPSPEQVDRLMELRIGEGDLRDRNGGVRFMMSLILDMAIRQDWSAWFLFEGAPFQSERAAYTDIFSGALLENDIGTYVRLGLTYKF
jgi:hypothetical protein